MEAKGLEPSNLLTASQALYQLSYAPVGSSTLVVAGTLSIRDDATQSRTRREENRGNPRLACLRRTISAPTSWLGAAPQ